MKSIEIHLGKAPYELPVTEVFSVTPESVLAASGGTEKYGEGHYYDEDSFE